ncbi:MAG TPA: hypothetical protein VFU60_10695 [Ktedonobacterales bacterium]|nr:hypothetical protein [Ktedonobacterales bacterium]
MAQETYKVPQMQWWGLPVGVVFIVSAVAATFYVNQGINDATTGFIGAIALLVLALGITSLGAFIYSIIARGVARTEAKNFVPEATH